MPCITVSSVAELQKLQGSVIAVNFFASWCEPCPQMNAVFEKLAGMHGSAMKFVMVDVEKCEDIPEKFDVTAVPTYLLLKTDLTVGGRVDGADAAKLTAMIQVAAKSVAATTTTTTTTTTSDSTLPPDVKKRLDALVTQQPIVLFMKGTPDAPRCGFSSKALALLTKHGVAFGHVDVLADAEARASMKAYANWPTFPQFWVGGKLIGGLDVANELESEGELGPMLKAAVAMASNVPESLDDRLRKLIASSPVMLFMKGDRTQPRCGFSAQIVKILDEHKVEYATFDILQDQTVRDGLKKLSNWPTYPQLYSKGKLIGGLDVVKELVEEKELENALK